MYIWSWLRSRTEAYNKPHITSTKVGAVVAIIDHALNRCMSTGKIYKDWTSLKPVCPSPGWVSKCTLASFGEWAVGAWWSTSQVYTNVKLWGQPGNWGLGTTLEVWQQPAHTHGTVLGEEGSEGEHFCRKRSCKMCQGEKIHIGGAARGHFKASKAPSKRKK